MYARCLGVLELVLGLREALLNALLLLGSTAAQSRFKGFERGRCDENVASIDAGVLDLLDALDGQSILLVSVCIP